MYVSYPGGCYSSPLKDKFPLSAEALPKDLKFEVSGVLGLNGISVDLYSYSDEQGTKIRLPKLTTTTTKITMTTMITILIIIIIIIMMMMMMMTMMMMMVMIIILISFLQYFPRKFLTAEKLSI